MTDIVKKILLKIRYASMGLGLSVFASAGLVPIMTIGFAEAADISADKIAPRTYSCSHNVSLPVTYIETASGNFYAILQVEGKQISMARVALAAPLAAAENKAAVQAKKDSANAAISGNAVPPAQKYFYLSLDEQQSYRWYPEGNTGKLTFFAADDSAQEEVVYGSCKLTGRIN